MHQKSTRAGNSARVYLLSLEGNIARAGDDSMIACEGSPSFEMRAIQNNLACRLEMAGYEVAEAHDYRDALPVLEDRSPVNLLVINVVLPGVHGFALARRARTRHHDIPCIYITAHDLPTSEALGPVLRKPLDANQLLKEIAAALSSRSAE